MIVYHVLPPGEDVHEILQITSNSVVHNNPDVDTTAERFTRVSLKQRT